MSIIVAIDGTSGSGKTTTARNVARKMGWFYLDTGATYRAVAYEAVKRGKDPENPGEIHEILKGLKIDVVNVNGKQRTLINGEDVTDKLRKDEIDRIVTPISKIKKVRQWLVNKQREIVNEKDAIVEGRDIGTVVFPEADLKIFMDAELDIRARRRHKEKDTSTELKEVKNDLKRRDKHDSTREESPLKRAPDSIMLDTTDLNISEQVAWVIDRIKQLNESTTSL